MKMRPISVEDREKIVKHKANGESEKNIAKWLMIGCSTVHQILTLHKKTGLTYKKRLSIQTVEKTRRCRNS
jgi:transposase